MRFDEEGDVFAEIGRDRDRQEHLQRIRLKRPGFSIDLHVHLRLPLTREDLRRERHFQRRVLDIDFLQQHLTLRSEERRVGKSVSVRVDLGGRRIIKTKTQYTKTLTRSTAAPTYTQ